MPRSAGERTRLGDSLYAQKKYRKLSTRVGVSFSCTYKRRQGQIQCVVRVMLLLMNCVLYLFSLKLPAIIARDQILGIMNYRCNQIMQG